MADGVRDLTGQLTGHRRQPADIPEVDEFPGGVRMYSPVTGTGSPLAPPMLVTPAEDGLAGQCLLGIAHEGPPGYGHGGISAMLLDELLGRACAAAGRPGMTISLHMRYQGPVPLETLLFEGERPRHQNRWPQDLRERHDHHRRNTVQKPRNLSTGRDRLRAAGQERVA
ncbi:PaaI family thioesterase [Streptomyces sioyaensis]|uniref:PaaI family thioesterase n=1 Tax=Streptomyces sioyaensis TaxID=67364 RepID=UPI0037D77F26